MWMSRTRRQKILDVASDLVIGLMYYDRKEDEELPRGAIEEAVKRGEITYQEIIDHFAKELLDEN